MAVWSKRTGPTDLNHVLRCKLADGVAEDLSYCSVCTGDILAVISYKSSVEPSLRKNLHVCTEASARRSGSFYQILLSADGVDKPSPPGRTCSSPADRQIIVD